MSRRDILPMVREELSERYRIGREIARGGAARVYLAYDQNDRACALKVLHPQLAVTVTADRFLREIAFLEQLDHPRIARIVDCGETERLLYYVMTYVEGPSLREHLTRVRYASESDTRQIACDLLDALAFAHERGIVHRDVKPDNIVLAKEGAVLLDFGIARAIVRSGTDRLTRSGFSVGTSAYMSPEQVRGEEDIDPRSDLYSLGCVLFECLTGKPPFVAPREDTVLRMHIEDHAPDIETLRDGTARDLAAAIDKALERERDQRWESAKEMLTALSGSC